MRKLAVILAIILSVVVVIAILLGLGIRRTVLEQAEGQAYVERVLPACLREWNSDLLFKETAPDFKQVTSSVELDSLFRVCADRLGSMKGYRGVQGNVTVWYRRRPDGETARGFYVAIVDFEEDVARVEVEIVKRDGRWRIIYFYLTSNAFLSPPEPSGEP